MSNDLSGSDGGHRIQHYKAAAAVRQAGRRTRHLSVSQIFKQRISFLISRVLYISCFYIKFGWCVVVVIRGMFTTQ